MAAKKRPNQTKPSIALLSGHHADLPSCPDARASLGAGDRDALSSAQARQQTRAVDSNTSERPRPEYGEARLTWRCMNGMLHRQQLAGAWATRDAACSLL
jgi:hypothetical protein